MNFLNFLTSGLGIFNSNLQNVSLNNNINPLLRTVPLALLSNKDECQSGQKNNNTLDNIVIQSENSYQPLIKSSQSELLSLHQQQLINQYMHLNIQFLSQKIENLQQLPQKRQDSMSLQVRNNKKKIKKLNINCEHNDKQHYAKGMCNNCYHKNGRNKKPWKCLHQKLYASGLCQNCYINKYNKSRRQKKINQTINFQKVESKQLNSKIQQKNE